MTIRHALSILMFVGILSFAMASISKSNGNDDNKKELSNLKDHYENEYKRANGAVVKAEASYGDTFFKSSLSRKIEKNVVKEYVFVEGTHCTSEEKPGEYKKRFDEFKEKHKGPIMGPQV